MSLTPQQMDAKMDEHFAFEGGDDVEGVLATLTRRRRARHRRVAARADARARGARAASTRPCSSIWPIARFECCEAAVRRQLHGRRVRCGAAGRRASRSASTGRGRPLEFRLLHVVEFCGGRRHQARERVGRSRRHHAANCRRTDMAADRRMRGAPTRRSRTRKDLLQRCGATYEAGAQARAWRRSPRRRWCRAQRPIAISRASRRCWWRPRWMSRCRRRTSCSAATHRRDPVARDGAGRCRAARHDPGQRAGAAHACSRTPCSAACRATRTASCPRRQNRRTPLIEAALEPAREQFKPAALADVEQGARPDHGAGRRSSCARTCCSSTTPRRAR